MRSAPPPTCRPWCSATWAIPAAPASASRAIPAAAKRSSMANSWSTRRAKTWWPASARHPRSPSSKNWNAEVYNQLVEITTSLENHYKDMQDFEFTVEEGKLYMLQTRNGKRTGPAAVRVAVEMVEEGMIDEKTAVHARRARATRSAAAPGLRLRIAEDAHQADHRHRRIARRRCWTRRILRRRGRRDGRKRPRHPGAQRDHARRYPRHG